MELQERLRVRQTAVVGALERADEPTAEDLIDALEVITEMEHYYTPEQMERSRRTGTRSARTDFGAVRRPGLN
jgi:hypothetical protein